MYEKRKIISVFDDIAAKGSWGKLYSGPLNRRSYNFVTRQRAVEELIEPFVKGEVLDVGCGTGSLAPFITQKGAVYRGVDMSGKMIEKAAAECSPLIPTGRVTFQVADCENLPFRDRTFDAVVAVALLEYLPAPRRFLEEVKRVTVAGASFLLTVMYKRCINSHIRACLRPITRTLFPLYVRFASQSLSAMGNVTHYAYDEPALDSLLQEHAFTRVGCRYSNFHVIPHPVDHVFPKLYMRLSEHIDRHGLGMKYRRWASNYIPIYRKNE